MKWQFDNNSTVYVTTDPDEMDRKTIFEYLHKIGYWSKGIPYDICMKSLDNSLPFTLIVNEKLIGFARLVTDYATFSYLADVFILDSHQGKGYGSFLIQCVNQWIEKNKIRTSLLLTRDAQTLYEKYDWVHPEDVKRVMRYKDPIKGFYDQLY